MYKISFTIILLIQLTYSGYLFTPVLIDTADTTSILPTSQFYEVSYYDYSIKISGKFLFEKSAVRPSLVFALLSSVPDDIVSSSSVARNKRLILPVESFSVNTDTDLIPAVFSIKTGYTE